MECKKLVRLIKEWYVCVKQETMAPVRMMQFVDKHTRNCEICRQDPDLPEEIEKIREFVVPESKIPKAVRVQEEKTTPEISPEEANELEHEVDNDHDLH